MVDVPCPPRRIVSLTPANTEILFAVGAGDLLAADTAFCNFPLEARRLPHVGDSSISVERVVAHAPDLVLAGGSASARFLPPLEGAGQRVFALDPQTLDEAMAAIKTVGRITAHETEAGRVVSGMRATVEGVRRRVRTRAAQPRVLVVLQCDPLWVAGSGTFVDELVAIAGGINIGRAAGDGYRTMSPERVAALQPQVILVSKDDAPAVRRRPGWQHIPAIQEGRVYSPDPDLINRPGPRLALGAKALADILHPTQATVRP